MALEITKRKIRVDEKYVSIMKIINNAKFINTALKLGNLDTKVNTHSLDTFTAQKYLISVHTDLLHGAESYWRSQPVLS